MHSYLVWMNGNATAHPRFVLLVDSRFRGDKLSGGDEQAQEPG